MKNIRQNVFETNSSSTHSISIADFTGLYDSFHLDEYGNIEFYGGRFGWEEDRFYDAKTKANYVSQYLFWLKACAANDYCLRERHEKYLSMFINMIKDHTGARDVLFNEDSLEEGYIDHQSADVCENDFVFESVHSLKEFIFNPDSYLQTDNDNH